MAFKQSTMFQPNKDSGSRPGRSTPVAATATRAGATRNEIGTILLLAVILLLPLVFTIHSG